MGIKKKNPKAFSEVFAHRQEIRDTTCRIWQRHERERDYNTWKPQKPRKEI